MTFEIHSDITNRSMTIASRAMRKVLRHEFRHHIEGRAGVRDLEEWDAEQIRAYHARKCEN
ncbi:MAG: hypothetical protein EGP70_00670 [Butyricicoccus sp.]|nr:hypothetical protein [Butyricicoccus sp.]